MSTAAIKLLCECDALPPAEKDAVMRELLRRTHSIDLRERGIDEAQAVVLRGRLQTFAEDWDRPEAGIYDEDSAR